MKFKEMISSIDDYSNELKILEGKGIKPEAYSQFVKKMNISFVFEG